MALEFLKSLEDYEHLLLVGAMIWGYFKYQEVKKSAAAEQEQAEKLRHQAAAEEIHAALNNGIGQKMKDIIREHETVEAMNIDKLVSQMNNEKNIDHTAIGQRIATLEQRVAVIESRFNKKGA